MPSISHQRFSEDRGCEGLIDLDSQSQHQTSLSWIAQQTSTSLVAMKSAAPTLWFIQPDTTDKSLFDSCPSCLAKHQGEGGEHTRNRGGRGLGSVSQPATKAAPNGLKSIHVKGLTPPPSQFSAVFGQCWAAGGAAVPLPLPGLTLRPP